jgi:hypothetical protein
MKTIGAKINGGDMAGLMVVGGEVKHARLLRTIGRVDYARLW